MKKESNVLILWILLAFQYFCAEKKFFKSYLINDSVLLLNILITPYWWNRCCCYCLCHTPINVFDIEHMFNLKCQCDIACNNKQRQISGLHILHILVATTCMFLFLIGEILHFICLYSREDLVSLNKCELDESCL